MSVFPLHVMRIRQASLNSALQPLIQPHQNLRKSIHTKQHRLLSFKTKQTHLNQQQWQIAVVVQLVVVVALALEEIVEVAEAAGGRGRGRRGGTKSDEKEWQPVTKLGRLVKAGKIKSMEEIYLHSLPIKEYQIVDFFLPKLKDEVMKVSKRLHLNQGLGIGC